MHAVAIWGETVGVLAGLADIKLSANERARQSRLKHVRHRDDYAAAHKLLRYCVRRSQLPSSIEPYQMCRICGGSHGAIHLADSSWHGSLSHSSGLVAAAISPNPVGIDVECRERVTLDNVRPVLSTQEQAWAARQADSNLAASILWTRKEAAVKAMNQGIDAMQSISLVEGESLCTSMGQLGWREVIRTNWVLSLAATGSIALYGFDDA